jgi:hypothetical protein
MRSLGWPKWLAILQDDLYGGSMEAAFCVAVGTVIFLFENLVTASDFKKIERLLLYRAGDLPPRNQYLNPP